MEAIEKKLQTENADRREQGTRLKGSVTARVNNNRPIGMLQVRRRPGASPPGSAFYRLPPSPANSGGRVTYQCRVSSSTMMTSLVSGSLSLQSSSKA
jgi:hypothetical protein